MPSIAYLQVWDYAIIVFGLTLSSAYGLYHGIRSRKETSKGATFEYLLASRNMSCLPIAFSYFASLTSTGAFIGYPAEVYSFGLQVALLSVTTLPCMFIINEIFLPVYYRLSSGSIYEYLELRFNTGIKNLVSVMAVFQTIVMSSAHTYGAATVLSQVTGFSSWFIVIVLSVLCIIYTTLGGMRAVILADVVQGLFMFFSISLLLAFGIYHVGDANLIYKRNLDTDRLNIFRLDLNFNVRHTFWNTTIGYFFLHMALAATSQFLVQRLMTAPNISVAKRANIFGSLMFVWCLFMASCVGLVMYATFHGCDPLQSGLVENMNQLVPAYLMKILSSYVTLPGIIFTGILCATLSTLSSVYNSTATILFNMFPKMSEKRAPLLCKTLVFSVGVLSTLGVAVVQLFPNVLQSIFSIYSAVSAPLLGMLFIGVFCPQANIKVTCVSFTCSVCFLLYIIAGTLLVKPSLVTQSLSADSCDPSNDTNLNSWINVTSNLAPVELHNVSLYYPITPSIMTSSSPWSAYFPLSSMSYLWYSAFGTLSTLLLFITLSLFVGKDKSKPVNLEIIPELVRKMHHKLPHNVRKILLCDVYSLQMQKSPKFYEVSERM